MSEFWQDRRIEQLESEVAKLCKALVEFEEWKKRAAGLLSRVHPGMHTCETSQWFTDRDEFMKGVNFNPAKQDNKG